MAIQFLDVLFQTLMVWSSEVEIYRMWFVVSETKDPEANAYNPRHFMMKLNGADVIQMSMQSKKTPPILWSDIWWQFSYCSPTNR